MKQPCIAHLSHLGFLKVSGVDAKRFLQGQLTCNMDEVTESQSRLGAHCNPKGRIISLFRIFLYQDSYYLLMPRSLITLAMNALQKYAVFFKVTLSDARDELIALGFIGEDLNKWISPLPLQDNDSQIINNLIITRIPGQTTRYIVIGNPAQMSTLWENTVHSPIEDWLHQDILAENIYIYPETSEKFLPHELNLHLKNGVSFNKGCYTGQEIIARMHYRGKLKNQLQHMTFTTPPQRGQDKDHYTIVDYCENPQNNYETIVLLTKPDLNSTGAT